MPQDRPADSPHADHHAEAARRDYRLLRRLMLFSLMLGCAGCFAFNFVDPDLWGHVHYGQEWIASGTLHRTATHTFTAEGYRWINHENLAELAMAAGFDLLGVRGMLAAKVLLGMTLISLMYWVACWRGVQPLLACALLLLVAVNLKPFFPMRPQLLSFFWCAVVLTLLEAAFLHWRRPFRTEPAPSLPARPGVDWRVLTFVPLVMVAWVNSHGGFVAGVAIVGAYLAGRMIEMLIDRRPGDAKRLAGLAAVGLGCLLATIANPYGPGLLQWIAESLGEPRPEITEWAPPKVTDPLFWQFIALLSVNIVAWGFAKRQRDWVKLAILVLVAWQATTHLRHIAFLALLTGFWTLPYAQDVLSRLRRKAADGLPVVRPAPAFKWAAVAAIMLTVFVQTRGLAMRLVVLPVEATSYPVQAIDYMSRHNLHGRLVVSFNWAQYALAALSPKTTISFDGRFRTCYPQEVVDMNFDFLLGEHNGKRRRSPASGEIDGARVLRHGSPDLVLVDRGYDHAVGIMRDNSVAAGGQWSLLYQDGVAQLWGRASRYDNPLLTTYLPPEGRTIHDRRPTWSVQWPALPDSSPAVARGDGPLGETNL